MMKCVLLSLCVLASCATKPAPLPTTSWTVRSPETDASTFAAGEQLLSGFDPVDTTAELGEGDRLLYGLLICEGTEALTRFVRIQVVDPNAHQGRKVALRVDVFDEKGALMGATDVRISRRGLLSSIPGLELMRIIRNTDILVRLLWGVVRKPSLLSLLGAQLRSCQAYLAFCCHCLSHR